MRILKDTGYYCYYLVLSSLLQFLPLSVLLSSELKFLFIKYLWYNSHTIQFIHLKYRIQWFLVYSHRMPPSGWSSQDGSHLMRHLWIQSSTCFCLTNSGTSREFTSIGWAPFKLRKPCSWDGRNSQPVRRRTITYMGRISCSPISIRK